MYNLYHCFVIDLFHFGRPWETLGESMGESINYQYSLNIDEKQYKIVKDKIFNHGRLGRVTLRRNTGRGYPPIPRNCKGIRKRVSSLPKREIMDVYERSHKALGEW